MLDAISTIPAVSALGWAVLHFLWQGCVIAGLAALALSGLRERSAQPRYVVGCVALACSLLTFAMTFAVALPRAVLPPPAFFAVLPFASPSVSTSGIGAVVPVIAWLWCVGAFLMTARFTGQWMAVHRIKRDATADVDDHAKRLFDTLCRELGVHRAIRFLRSRLADVPMVVGWFSPAVVVPVSAFTSLTPDQLRAVLAHELAHIRRYDYLVNGIQSIIEIILFFHPALWWLSGQVRHEREQCCDDIAVHSAGNATVYAKALSRLEALRDEHTQIALAANGGLLMQRIERILGTNANTRLAANGWRIATGLTVVLALVAVGVVYAAASGDDSDRFSNPTAQTLQDALQAGELSPEEAREMYFRNVYPGSEAQAKIEHEFERVTAEIDAAVAAGKLSSEDAEGKLTWLREQRARNEDLAFSVEVRGLSLSEAYLEHTAAQLVAMFARGELSAADAAAKRMALEDQIAAKEEIRRQVAAGERTASEAYLEQAAAKLNAMVERGDLSAEDAEAKLSAIEKQVAVKEELARQMASGRSKSEVYLEQVAAKLEAMVKSGELSAENAEAKMIAIENAVGGKAKTGSLDTRTVLRAVKRVDLSSDQKDNVRNIERAAIGAYRKISRKDKQGHNKLAEQVKAEITKLLDDEQIERFESALKRLDRGSRRAKQPQRRQVAPESDTDGKKAP